MYKLLAELSEQNVPIGLLNMLPRMSSWVYILILCQNPPKTYNSHYAGVGAGGQQQVLHHGDAPGGCLAQVDIEIGVCQREGLLRHPGCTHPLQL